MVLHASPPGQDVDGPNNGQTTAPSSAPQNSSGETVRDPDTGNLVSKDHSGKFNGAGRTANPVVESTGQTISSTLDTSQGGALDPVRVGQAQSAASSAISQSEHIDRLYIERQITKAEWQALKASMTARMMAPINSLNPSSTLSAQKAPQPRGSRESSSTSTASSTPTSTPTFSSSAPAEVSVGQSLFSDSRRALSPVPESDPIEVGAGAQVLSLNSAGPMVVGTTLVQDKVSETQASESLKESSNQKQLQMDENTKAHSASGQTVVLGSSSLASADKGLDRDRAMLVAQKILQDHNAKAAKKGAKAAPTGANESVGAPVASSVAVAQAKAMASLQNLPKVKRVQGMDGKDISSSKINPEEVGAALALSADRAPASVGTVFEAEEEGLSNTSLMFMGLLGLFAGLAVAYGLFMRPQKSFVQLMVPSTGEHFAVRPGSKPGEFILEIMDIRGKLVKTAGTLRPNSVARASVLPPDLAARLGAKGNFERFELNNNGEFVSTEKEEGYQVFPFVLNEKKAS
jgi:hypothetical protein